MNYAVDMGSGAVHTKFYEDLFSHSKVGWGEYRSNRKLRARISILLFFIIRKVI
jgi:hypothetical protein